MPFVHEIEVLNKLASYQKQALRNGYRDREAMHAALEAGLEPDCYRVRWLKDSVIKICKLLEQLAVEFNEENANDRCSSLDLADALSTTLSHIQGADKD